MMPLGYEDMKDFIDTICTQDILPLLSIHGHNNLLLVTLSGYNRYNRQDL